VNMLVISCRHLEKDAQRISRFRAAARENGSNPDRNERLLWLRNRVCHGSVTE
jgi:hypothetical protein